MSTQLTLAPFALLDNFFQHVEKVGCWQWTGATDRGYGKFYARHKTVRAHRWLYEQLVGPVPDGLVLDHVCRNRACVNPDHLEVVTQRENLRRSPLMGRNVLAQAPGTTARGGEALAASRGSERDSTNRDGDGMHPGFAAPVSN